MAQAFQGVDGKGPTRVHPSSAVLGGLLATPCLCLFMGEALCREGPFSLPKVGIRPSFSLS